MCKIYLITEMTRYLFVNNLKFVEPVMSSDSRDKPKQGRAVQSPNFACVKTFLLSHKSSHASFSANIYIR